MRYLKTQFLIHVGCRNSNGQLDIEFKKHDQALTTNIDDLASQMDYVYVYMCMSQVSFGMPAKNNTMSADLHQHVCMSDNYTAPGVIWWTYHLLAVFMYIARVTLGRISVI